LKVLFFGTPAWAVPSLEALRAAGHEIVGVVSAPDAPVGRSRTPAAPPVKARALELGLGPILQPTSLRPAAAREELLARGAEVFVVVAYGRILPGRLLDAPRFGAVNLHFSLLPRHRGASPVQTTLLRGDAEAGVSTMLMDRGLDEGPILLRRAAAIAPREKAAALGARLALVGAELLVETLAALADGTARPTPQDGALATLAPPLAKADGLLRWEWSAVEIERRTRAFDPWPPVVCRGPKGTLRLLDVEALAEAAPDGAAPGLVLRRAGEAADAVAGDGRLLRIHAVQPAGSKPMSAAAALAGRRLALGEALGDGEP